MQRNHLFLLLGTVALATLCAVGGFALLGSGVAFLALGDDSPGSPAIERPPTRRAVAVITLPAVTPTPTLTPSPTNTSTPPPTLTATASPTPPPTATPTPTDTPAPTPTNEPTATPAPPTPTPLPTDTPTPTPVPYAFSIKESQNFGTNHLNFDVYVAVVDDSNSPLRNYRVIGAHSSGMQVESRPSAGDWTENSGAMHYKAGNIKFEVMNSPGGIWTLQLVDPDGVPAAPPVELPFDSGSPSWYFLIYERES